jgi:hypothetical protein
MVCLYSMSYTASAHPKTPFRESLPHQTGDDALGMPPRGDNLYSLSRAAPAGSDHPEDQSQGLGLVVVLTEGKVSWTTQ